MTLTTTFKMEMTNR